MKAQTFKEWLAESTEANGRPIPKNISLITAVAGSQETADSAESAVKEILNEMKATRLQIVLVLPVSVLDLVYIWIGWNEDGDWGFLLNPETGQLDSRQDGTFRSSFSNHDFSIDSMRHGWQAVNTLIRYWKTATVDDLMWIKAWCDQYEEADFSDLIDKLKEHPNWPEDMTDWALDEW